MVTRETAPHVTSTSPDVELPGELTSDPRAIQAAPVSEPAGLPEPRRFVLAGKAIFTLSSPTGARYTFKVSQGETREGDSSRPAPYTGDTNGY